MRNKKINWVLAGGGFLMLAMGSGAVAMQKGMSSTFMRMDKMDMSRMDKMRMSRLTMAGMQRDMGVMKEMRDEV